MSDTSPARRTSRRRSAPDSPIADIARRIGERIRLRRSLLGVSQTELGNRIGLTFQQVQKYERGTNHPAAAQMVLIANALDVPVSFFFDGLQDAVSGDRNPASEENLPVRGLATIDPGVAIAVSKLVLSLRTSRPASPHTDPSDAEAKPRKARTAPNGVRTPAVEQDAPAPPAPAEVTERPLRRRPRGAVWDPSDIKG